MKLVTGAFLAVLLVTTGSAHAADCVGLLKNAQKEPNRGDFVDLLGLLLPKAKSSGAPCGSVVSVIDRVINRKKTAGRRLEGDKPFNASEAQANVQAALRDPEVRKKIERLKVDVPDENLRFVYEAAIFDEEGYYNARELRIQQLLQRLK